MTTKTSQAFIAIAGILTANSGAQAHVVYRDISIPSGFATLGADGYIHSKNHVLTNSGWIDGADTVASDVGATCGVGGQPACVHDATMTNNGKGTNSHSLKYQKFTVTTQSLVEIKVNAITDGSYKYVPHGTSSIQVGLGDLLPGFSIYSGLVPHLSHDYAPVPMDGNGDGQPDPFDSDSDGDGRADTIAGGTPLYDRAHGGSVDEKGVGYTLGDITMFNTPWERFPTQGPNYPAPEIATIHYLGHAINNGGQTVSGSWVLGPGVYTVIVGGTDANGIDPYYNSNPNYVYEGRAFELLYKASPVPVPAAAWLFGSAIVGLAGIGSRRRKTA